jgi:TRAP-type transport system periplasmic protein
MRSKSAVFGASLAIAGTLGIGHASAQTVNLVFANSLPRDHIQYGVIADEWIKRIEEVTEGRVRIRHVPGGSLLTQEQMLEGVGGGVADCGVANVSNFPGRLPIAATLAGTASVTYGNLVDTKGAGAITWQLAKDFPEYLQEFRDQGVFPVVWVPTSHFAILSKTPINSLADFEGLKIRSFGPNLPRMLAAAGATPMAVAVLEVYTSLQTGVLDAGMTDLPMMNTGRWYEQAKHLVTTGPRAGAMTVAAGVAYMCNLNSWNRISEADRDLIAQVSEETNMYAALRLDKLGQEMFDELRSKGVEIYHLTEAETEELARRSPDFLAEAAKVINDAGKPGTAIVERYRELATSYAEGRWNPFEGVTSLRHYDLAPYLQ